MDLEDDLPKKPRNYELGADLSKYSINELEAYLAALEEEKHRVSAMIDSKKASRDVADSVFKF